MNKSVTSPPRVRRLDATLANQIAAGGGGGKARLDP